jgi:hypothetical protein
MLFIANSCELRKRSVSNGHPTGEVIDRSDALFKGPRKVLLPEKVEEKWDRFAPLPRVVWKGTEKTVKILGRSVASA